MFTRQRKLYSQNFLHNRKLTSSLVRGSSINKNNLILEIGPGKGILTDELIKQARHVIAVEIDHDLYSFLQVKFKDIKNLTLIRDNFLNFSLPKTPYKVFANIPFSIEGEIIRKLIDAKNPPEDAYLVVMKELAYRLSAPHKENQFSITHKPWFAFSIYHHFNPTDFVPVPSVNSVILRFKKRSTSLLPWSELKAYQEFIRLGFGQGMSVFYNLKIKFGYKKIIKVFHCLKINKQEKPSYLSLEKWVELYKRLNKYL